MKKQQKKKFKCNFCEESFDHPCSLGGHVSKNHPGKSK